MKGNRSVSFQRQKNHRKPIQIKEHLSQLASKIKVGMDENQVLMETINNLCVNIHRSKQQLKKFTSFHGKGNIEAELNKNNNNLKTTNKNLAIQRKLLFQKYIKLKNKYNNELEPLNTELNILTDRKFIMENIAKKKDYEINKITNEYKDTINLYLREEKKEIITNNLDLDEDIIIANLERSQGILLNKLKEFNKVVNKCNELKKSVNTLKNIIKKIEEKKFDDLTLDEKDIIYNKKNNKKEIIDYQNIYEMTNSVEEDSILNETITSEYEDDENFEFFPPTNNLCPIKLDGKFKIPKIDLGQIEYNKRKFKQEDAEKSLSRDIEGDDSEDLKIREIKNNIRKAKNKNKKYQNKCANFQKKLKMMEKIIKNMTMYNYEMSMSSARNTKIKNFQFTDSKTNNNENIGEIRKNNAYTVRGRSSSFGKKYFKNINNNKDIDIFFEK